MLGTPVTFHGAKGDVSVRSMHETPNDIIRELEGLVSSLEESFQSTEKVFNGTPTSPRAAAKISVEKARRQKLLSKITQIIAQDAERNGNTSVGGGSAGKESREDLGESIAQSDSSAEWKHKTLLRLHKFLRKQYRLRKSRLVDSASKDSATPESLAQDRAQLQQLASDIRSIEFEIRLLSNAKTIVQHAKKSNAQASSASSSSRHDSVAARLLFSGASAGKGDKDGDDSALASADGVGEPRSGLQAVKRNLLSIYERASSPLLCGKSSSASAAPGAGKQAREAAPLDATEAKLIDVGVLRGSAEGIGGEVHLSGPSFDVTQEIGGADGAGRDKWSDVDLARWANAARANVSPVAKGVSPGTKGTISSPVPIVLPHRVVRRGSAKAKALFAHSSAGSAGRILPFDSASQLSPDRVAGEATAAPARAAADDGGHERDSLDFVGVEGGVVSNQPLLEELEAQAERIAGELVLRDRARLRDGGQEGAQEGEQQVRARSSSGGAGDGAGGRGGGGEMVELGPGRAERVVSLLERVAMEAEAEEEGAVGGSEEEEERMLGAREEREWVDGAGDMVEIGEGELDDERIGATDESEEGGGADTSCEGGEAGKERGAEGGRVLEGAKEGGEAEGLDVGSCLLSVEGEGVEGRKGGGKADSPAVESDEADGSEGAGGVHLKDDEQVLLRTIKKILDGPSPQTARYIGNKDSKSAAQFFGDDGRDPSELRAADEEQICELSLECLRALPPSPLQMPPLASHLSLPRADAAAVAVASPQSSPGDPSLSASAVPASACCGGNASATSSGHDSLSEGLSLLADHAELALSPASPSRIAISSIAYVHAATPTGEPSKPVVQALAAAFETCRQDEPAHDHVGDHVGGTGEHGCPPAECLGSTPTGEPSRPVAMALAAIFDQCVDERSGQSVAYAEDPPEEEREEGAVLLTELDGASPSAGGHDEGEGGLRAVAKRLDFSEAAAPRAKSQCVAQTRGAGGGGGLREAPRRVPCMAWGATGGEEPAAAAAAPDLAREEAAGREGGREGTAAAMCSEPVIVQGDDRRAARRAASREGERSKRAGGGGGDIQRPASAAEGEQARGALGGGEFQRPLSAAAGGGIARTMVQSSAGGGRSEGGAMVKRQAQPRPKGKQGSPSKRSPSARKSPAGKKSSPGKGGRVTGKKSWPLAPERGGQDGKAAGEAAGAQEEERREAEAGGGQAEPEPEPQCHGSAASRRAVPALSSLLVMPLPRTSPSPNQAPPIPTLPLRSNGLAPSSSKPARPASAALASGKALLQPAQPALNPNKVDLLSSLRMARRTAPKPSAPPRKVPIVDLLPLPKPMQAAGDEGGREREEGGRGQPFGRKVAGPMVVGTGIAALQPSRRPPPTCVNAVGSVVDKAAEGGLPESRDALPPLLADDALRTAQGGGDFMAALREAASEKLASFKAAP